MRFRLASNAVLALATHHKRSAVKMSTTSIGSSTTRCVERKITCSDGITLSAQCWPAAGVQSTSSSSSIAANATGVSSNATSNSNTRATTRKILCLHGWLDNSATFHLLAPALSARLNSPSASTSSTEPIETEIVALDLPGHGLSSHKSKDGPPQILAEYVFYVSEALDGLGWTSVGGDGSDSKPGKGEENKGGTNEAAEEDDEKIILLGHSMGAGISTTFAATFPHLVDSIILLEGAGPLARRSEDTAKHIRNAVERRKRGNRVIYGDHGQNSDGDSVSDIGAGSSAPSSNGAKTGVRIYPNLNAAVDVRVSTARLAPGKQYLSREAAAAMVSRATVPYVGTPAARAALSAARASGENVQGFTDESVVFCHDPRLQWPSLQYFTREQVDALYDNVECPVCLISAEDGWPFGGRERKSVEELLRPTYQKKLPGSHHFHADPDTADAVLEEVVAFLERE